jgi:hypothetical protein
MNTKKNMITDISAELEKEFGFTIDSITDADIDDLLIGSYMD